MVPWRLKHDAETGPGAGSKAKDIEGGGEDKKKKRIRVISIQVCKKRRKRSAGNVLFRRVRASLSQKLMVPSEPQVENVP